MIDYYPLLSRAIVNLGDSAGPDVRRAIYDRARTALRSQLEEMDPPLPQDQIERERAQLEAVIARLEMEARARSRPAAKLPLRYRKASQASPPEEGAQGEASADTIEPVPDAPHASDEALHLDRASSHGPAGEPSELHVSDRRPPWFAGWGVLAVAVAAVLIIGSLAGLAYVMRDQIDPVRREQAEQAAAANPVSARPAEPEAKNPARLGGPTSRPATSPPSAPSPAPATAAATPAVATSAAPSAAVPTEPNGSQSIPIAQRATLFLEVAGGTDQSPRTVAGRVIWSFENLPSNPGQPLDPALVGAVDIPDAGITLRMQVTRNHDGSLPASHLVGLVFTTKDSNVKDISPVLMKTAETDPGTALVGIQQPLGPNLFIMALSAADADVAKNFDLLTRREWVEVQFRLADQRRGAVVFDKGISGNRALLTAIDAWK
ncbi:MAG: hypothetical protein JOZ30_10090 [Hyphomicrobiales bacterium]|nr:hypothetical protein [Hyphomicrobiales bacterium]